MKNFEARPSKLEIHINLNLQDQIVRAAQERAILHNIRQKTDIVNPALEAAEARLRKLLATYEVK